VLCFKSSLLRWLTISPVTMGWTYYIWSELFHISGRWWRQQVPLKRRWTFTRLHGATTHKTAVFILAAVRTWNPTWFIYPTLFLEVGLTYFQLVYHFFGYLFFYFLHFSIKVFFTHSIEHRRSVIILFRLEQELSFSGKVVQLNVTETRRKAVTILP
jgi:hypothetical protein